MSARSCCVTCGIVAHAARQVLGGLAPDGTHRLPIDLAPAGEIRQRLARPAARLRRRSAPVTSRFACALTSSIEIRPSGPAARAPG